MSRRSSRVRRTNIQNNTQKYSGKWGLQGLVDCRGRNKVLCQYIKRRSDGSQSVSSPSPPAPSAITDLVATAIGFPASGTDASGTSITIQLTWTPPSGTITDYEYKVNSGAWISTGSAIQPYDYSGVVGGGEYTFMIRAKNGVSVGNDSNLSNAITAPTAQFQTRAEIIAAIPTYNTPTTEAIYNNIDNWKFKNTITDFSNLFAGLPNLATFDEDISSWTTDSITNMSGMFKGATAFNQNIGGWTTNNVTNMFEMFQNAIAFNQDISSWDVSSVTNMIGMFYYAHDFNNGGINWTDWNVSSVQLMGQMFQGAGSFNQDCANWDLTPFNGFTGVIYMDQIFNGSNVITQNWSGHSNWRDAADVIGSIDGFYTNGGVYTPGSHPPGPPQQGPEINI